MATTTATAVPNLLSKENVGVQVNVNIDNSLEDVTTSTGVTTNSTNNNDNENRMGPTGCYMVFEPSSGGRLMLQYSQGPVPDNAVGFWAPHPTQRIQGFKFKQAGGKSELIRGIAGGDANRKKYFTGWCQFIKQCKAKKGSVIQFVMSANKQGVDVDVYGYIQKQCHPQYLSLDRMTSIEQYDAIAVVPKHHEFLMGVQSLPMSTFLEKANISGAGTILSS